MGGWVRYSLRKERRAEVLIIQHIDPAHPHHAAETHNTHKLHSCSSCSWTEVQARANVAV